MINYACPKCGDRLRVDDLQAGKVFVCGLCGERSLVPGEGAVLQPSPEVIRPRYDRVQCHCGVLLTFDAPKHAGEAVACGSCGATFTLVDPRPQKTAATVVLSGVGMVVGFVCGAGFGVLLGMLGGPIGALIGAVFCGCVGAYGGGMGLGLLGYGVDALRSR